MRMPAQIKTLPLLMGATVLAIIAFQAYWLQKAYEREERSLERQTNMLFRETIGQLQASKVRFDRVPGDTGRSAHIVLRQDPNGNPVSIRPIGPKDMELANAIARRMKDSGRIELHRRREGDNRVDSLRVITRPGGRRDRIVQFLFDLESEQDSIRVAELRQYYSRNLDSLNIDVPFTISRVPTVDTKEPIYNEVTLGFQSPITFRLDLGNTTGFLLLRIAAPLVFSFFLVGFTVLSFTLLYRNLMRQRRLADVKNEFISNITHELKTPIATVSVAIEALRSFSASLDPQRTKEYLDISANELQRLSLLVDKVLKLSMFEKREIELKYEHLNMRELVDEVTSSMRLQFEKHKADVSVDTEGDLSLEGDRLHLVSVIFNLMDNALKYSKDRPQINVRLRGESDAVVLSIADKGIGIPKEYQGKVFDKFFRVPTGNLHNAKGYGLGLSYVGHVVKRHSGIIELHSEEGRGSRFEIRLPRRSA